MTNRLGVRAVLLVSVLWRHLRQWAAEDQGGGEQGDAPTCQLPAEQVADSCVPVAAHWS